MQWVGGLIFFVTLVGMTIGKKDMTIKEARAELDRIEATNPPSVQEYNITHL